MLVWILAGTVTLALAVFFVANLREPSGPSGTAGRCPRCLGPLDRRADYPGRWATLVRCDRCGHSLVFTDARDGDAAFPLPDELAARLLALEGTTAEELVAACPLGPSRLPESIEPLLAALRRREPGA
jgi:hypothetical protein